MDLKKMFDLSGKTAVVTGGGQGIGQVVALYLARAGASVAILNRSNADETVSQIKKEGGKACFIACDVTNEAEVDNAFEKTLELFGSVDVVINNAGICMHKSALDVTVEEFRRVIDVNLTGVFIVARATGRIMIDRGIHGSIINISSASGVIIPTPQHQCSYNSSKAGVTHLTKSLAIEWVDYNIRVNSVSPGYVATPIATEVPQKLKDAWMPLIPMHRMAKPEELIPPILYLASDASGYTTGSDVVVDGAYSCL